MITCQKNIKLIRDVAILLLMLLTSCIKEKFDAGKFDASLSLNPGLAVPVGYSHLGIDKYLMDASAHNELRISRDGFISLFYKRSVASGILSNILSFPQINVNKSIYNQTGAIIDLQTPGASLSFIDSVLIPLSLLQATARIDSIHLLSGTLQVNLLSSNLTGTVTCQFPGLRFNGVPYTFTGSFPNPGFNLSLANYTILPEHDAGGNNILKCRMTIHIQNPSGPVNNGSLLISAQVNLNSLNYETIFGDFSGYSIGLPDIGFTTSVFRQVAGGYFRFADPKLKLLFSNAIGIPLGLSFSRFDAIDRNNNHLSFTGPGIPTLANPRIINYPTLSQSGQTVKDSIILDNSNSNLADLLSSNPDSICITASDITAPLPGTGTSFINHDSKYDVTAVIELPLWGKAEFLILRDTLAFDYLAASLPDPKELEKLIVHINITNSFPVSLVPQIYLLDENRMLLDSLFTGAENIEGANDINGDGIADPHIQDPIDIDLPRVKIDILKQTHYLVTRGRIMTTNFPAENVKFYAFYFLDYNIGLIAQLKIKTGK